MKGVRKMVRVQMIIKLLPFNFIEVTFTVFNSNEITAYNFKETKSVLRIGCPHERFLATTCGTVPDRF